jgi:hypothetical protein
MYKTERHLIQQFVRRLRDVRCPWGTVKVSREFDYDRGRADLVAVAEEGSHLIAFEAKLEKWRHALQQAYRNTCFAHSSYVILPRCTALRAQRYAGEFARRNVGLCYIDGDTINIVLLPKKNVPIEPWLLDAALAAAKDQGDAKRRIGRGCTENLPETSPTVR